MLCLGMITLSGMMHPELNCRNRSFGWDCSLKFHYTFCSLCTVIVVGVNEVNKGIGDKGIFEKYRITLPPDSEAIRAEPHHGRRVATSKLTANTACQSPGVPDPQQVSIREGQNGLVTTLRS